MVGRWVTGTDLVGISATTDRGIQAYPARAPATVIGVLSKNAMAAGGPLKGVLALLREQLHRQRCPYSKIMARFLRRLVTIAFLSSDAALFRSESRSGASIVLEIKQSSSWTPHVRSIRRRSRWLKNSALP